MKRSSFPASMSQYDQGMSFPNPKSVSSSGLRRRVSEVGLTRALFFPVSKGILTSSKRPVNRRQRAG